MAGELEFDRVIIVRWDKDEGRVVYDIGDLDEYAAYAMLTDAAQDVRSRWPDPRQTSDPVDEDEGRGS